MQEQKTNRVCLNCRKQLRGRSDKKFCDDYCRNSYNNLLKARDNNLMRTIHNSLRKNRRILRELLKDQEIVTATREELSLAGFNFKYLTQAYIKPGGRSCFYCYEYAYQFIGSDKILVMQNRGSQDSFHAIWF